MLRGRTSAFRTSGNGNTLPKELMDAIIRGGIHGNLTQSQCPTRAVPCAGLTRLMRILRDNFAFEGDAVGNVWQWTEQFEDDHTVAGILRGGSYYQPQGSEWYFPQAYKLSEHGKLLMTSPSMDRSGALGFRCAQDAN